MSALSGSPRTSRRCYPAADEVPPLFARRAARRELLTHPTLALSTEPEGPAAETLALLWLKRLLAGQTGLVRRFRVREYLASSLWFLPLVCVLVGAALSFVTIALDRWLGSVVPRSLSGDPEAALAILTTVAASMVTLTALVLTITMVVVQLAMGQFTPRVLRTILRDRPSQIAIGVFVATFAHAMLVMREVRAPGGEDGDGYVPGLAIVVAYVLIIVSIMVLVSYVHHIGNSLRVASLIEAVGSQSREMLAELFPEGRRPAEPPVRLPSEAPTQVVAASEPGVVFKVDTRELVEHALAAGGVLVLVPQVGDFVPQGATVVELYAAERRLDERDVLKSVAFGRERTLHQDLAYGLRMLVDVAVRSVSEAMGDPTTAIQAIDRLHDCLRQLVTRDFPSGHHFDDAGRLRLVVPIMSWDGYMSLALDELRTHARSSIQVTRRLAAMLEDLRSVAPPDRRPAVEHQLRLLHTMAMRTFDDEHDASRAVTPDQQGIGAGRDLVDAPIHRR
jgi:uncharacterized membrane protein